VNNHIEYQVYVITSSKGDLIGLNTLMGITTKFRFNCSWHSLYSKFNSFRDSYSNDIKFTVNENTFEIDSYIFIYIYQQFLKWN